MYSGDTSLDHDLRISHVAIDRKHTTAEDQASYFPLAGPAPRRRGGPHRPARAALPRRADQPQPAHDARCRCAGDPGSLQADAVDAAILVANCPVCHQTVALVARLLERSGIATVVMGCAKDIVERAGVPRLLFSDFPLGNAAGRPNDLASQDFTLELALRLLESAPAPRTTVQSPLRWSDDPDWKLDYCNVDRLTPEEIGRRRAEFDEAKRQAKQLREAPRSELPASGEPAP